MKHAPALLSFFLPGLGQLSQKRPVWAMGFFLAFAIATAVGKVWWVVPIIALISGLETFRFRNSPPIADKKLRYAYGAVGGVGFLAWFGFVAGHWFPLGQQMAMNDDVERIRRVFRECHDRLGKNENDIITCVRSVTIADPWGRPYELAFDGVIFEIRSSGADGTSGSDDDGVYRTTVRGGS